MREEGKLEAAIRIGFKIQVDLTEECGGGSETETQQGAKRGAMCCDRSDSFRGAKTIVPFTV